MHVALNDESEYAGGRLVFATAAGFEMPPRPAGNVRWYTPMTSQWDGRGNPPTLHAYLCGGTRQ